MLMVEVADTRNLPINIIYCHDTGGAVVMSNAHHNETLAPYCRKADQRSID